MPQQVIADIDTMLKWVAQRHEELTVKPPASPFEEIQLAAAEAYWRNYRARVVSSTRTP